MDPSKPIHIIINLKNKFNSEAVENFKTTFPKLKFSLKQKWQKKCVRMRRQQKIAKTSQVFGPR
jgi:hypothetical protein